MAEARDWMSQSLTTLQSPSGFCLVYAFSYIKHCYLNLIISKANAIAVPVEYKLTPEHPLPAAFEECLCVFCGEDEPRDKGVAYCEAVKKSGREGEVDLLEVEGEDHCLHILNVETENAKKILNRLS
ncbi:2-hydroxyisoflavanone dehydratase-like [Prosopis cineraria]|uniref:2-hydroxyisoflavanone dehydratase-like n=1 Tax=Prosopis cineraria TaxID=364024 RepID=UPI00240FD30A|nr:2-hydroxyisoflavanone dehydratase-like [Prosopis cineraria]XP_054801598.1 2-hydroxyisoflavanone dehydratase-like [Prosopis cineraria]